LGIVKFNLEAGIKVVDLPPQPTDAIADVLAATVEGRTTYMIAPISITQAPIREGKLFPLGVTTARRSTLLPEVPTITAYLFAYFANFCSKDLSLHPCCMRRNWATAP
jgi:tripartite-type tricarboxylate transporter receptor subunit TctC